MNARHVARVVAWLVVVVVCLVPITAVVIAPVTDPPRDTPRVTTTTTTAPSTTVMTTPPVTVLPGSPTEANDMGDPTFVPGAWTTASTFYCLPGVTADGSGVTDGIVAVSYANWARMRGTSWKVTAGPADLVGRVFTVHDKGPRARFDIWTGDCAAAKAYGRHTITVTPA